MRAVIVVVVSWLLWACSDHPVAVPVGPRDAGPPAAPWALVLPAFIDSVAADARGNVYALSDDGVLYAFGPSGVSLFQHPLSTAGLRHRNRLAGTAEGTLVLTPERVIRFAADGTTMWERAFVDGFGIASNDTTIAIRARNALVGLRLDDGREIWRTAADPLDPLGAREGIVTATRDGGWIATPPVVAYGPDGRMRWARDFPFREIHGLAAADDGTIAVTGVYSEPHFDLPNAGNFDPYVLLFDHDGGLRTALAFHGDSFEYAYAAGARESQFLVGGHYGEASQPLQVGPYSLEPAGDHDGWLAWIGADGTVSRATSLATPGWIIVRAVTWSPRGRWVVAGLLRGASIELAGTELTGNEGAFSGFLWVGPE
jgi:outer membrane protein assembly factor BamB